MGITFCKPMSVSSAQFIENDVAEILLSGRPGGWGGME